jgi:GNAT superfamily N-acetyltransferase
MGFSMAAKDSPTYSPNFACHAVTPERWHDFERLFGPRGACGGCWCQWWKLPRAVFDQQKGEGNKRALRAAILGGDTPGIIAYAGDEPAGWCAIAPRDQYPGLARSRILKPVWSVTCFFIARPYRRQGLSALLLRSAVEHATAQGAAIVEGYPVEPRRDTMPDVYAWTGLAATFLKVGFVEVARRSDRRPIVRLDVTRR